MNNETSQLITTLSEVNHHLFVARQKLLRIEVRGSALTQEEKRIKRRILRSVWQDRSSLRAIQQRVEDAESDREWAQERDAEREQEEMRSLERMDDMVDAMRFLLGNG